jgi:hypothetical protein
VAGSFTAGAVDSDALADNIAFQQYNTVNVVSANSVSINLNNGMIQYIDLQAATGTVAISVSNPIQGATYRFIVIQGSSSQSVTWPANFDWQGAVSHGTKETATDAGTISEGDNERDMIVAYCGRNPPATTDVFYVSFELNIS